MDYNFFMNMLDDQVVKDMSEKQVYTSTIEDDKVKIKLMPSEVIFVFDYKMGYLLYIVNVKQ